MTYRLQEPLLSLKRHNEGRPQLRALAAGTLVVITSTVTKTNLIDVLVDGEPHSVFLVDVQERGQLVESAKVYSASACTRENVLMLKRPTT
jgi:hypothetical protein